MNQTVTRLAGLKDTELIAMHKRLDEFVSADAAIIEAHHHVTTEMLRRNISHGHIDDAWGDAVVLIEKAEVQSPDDIDAPEGMEKAWSQTLSKGGTVSVLLTVDGYVLKADPTVSDVHVDAVMGSGKKRPQRVVGTAEKESGFTIPAGVQTAAKRALKWISEGKAGDGFTSVGHSRARQLADGGSVSKDMLVKMRAYFARHGAQRGDHASLDDGEPTPWRVAWDAWGGDAGQTWVNRVLTSVEKRAIPDAITDIHLNLENRQHAIDEYLYGPMNPDAPGDFWKRLGDVWKVDADEAKTTRCGNCAAFNQKPEILEAIADGISDEGDAVVDAADLGYCELFEFKCAAARSCSAWLTGGPLVKSFNKSQNRARETKATFTLPDGAVYEILVPEGSVNGLEAISKHASHDQKTHGNWATGVSSGVASTIQQFTRDWGGLSISMVDGSMPTTGYMVSKPPSFGKVVDEADFFDPVKGPKILSQYMREQKSDLATGKNYLGTWLNGGKVYLDVSENILDVGKATRLGRERDQIKIWDVANQVEIDTGGTGGVKKESRNGGVEELSQHDGRGDRRLRERDLGKTQQSVVKHQGSKHDQLSHGNWADGSKNDLKIMTDRRREAIDKKDTVRSLPRDSSGRVINPEATGGYKAGIPETVVFRGNQYTPEHSLWHHLEGNVKDGFSLTEERAALHIQIVEEATRGIPASNDPTFHMLGGGPASGKTTAIESGLAEVPGKGEAVQINADDIKEKFSTYERMRFSADDNDFFNAASFSHEESSLLAKTIQERALANGQDVVLDGTGDSKFAKLEKKIKEARDAGYKVNAVYATIPISEAIKRSNKRSLRLDGRRFVPEDIITGTHRDISAVFPEAVREGLFDTVKLIDNTILNESVLVAEAVGSQLTIKDTKLWNEFLGKAG